MPRALRSAPERIQLGRVRSDPIRADRVGWREMQFDQIGSGQIGLNHIESDWARSRRVEFCRLARTDLPYLPYLPYLTYVTYVSPPRVVMTGHRANGFFSMVREDGQHGRQRYGCCQVWRCEHHSRTLQEGARELGVGWG